MKKVEMVHLHVHSTYSELDAIAKIPQLVKRAIEFGHKAITLTDHGTIAGVPEFYAECKRQGIKSILGSEFYMVADAEKSRAEKKRLAHHLVLLAMNDEGWTNIKKLTTKANEKFYYVPRIDYKDLVAHSDGIICMTACLKGIVPYYLMEKDFDEATKNLIVLHGIFGNRLYLEIQDGGLDVQVDINQALRRMAANMQLKCVATVDSHYIDKDDVEAHEGLWAIRTGHTFDVPIGYGKGRGFRPYYSTREYWLKDACHILGEPLTTENDEQRMSTVLQGELEATLEVVDRIGDVKFEKKIHLPKYGFIPDIRSNSFQYLEKLVEDGYETLFGHRLEDAEEIYKARIAKEMADIKDANLADYFLIVWDIVSWARSEGIPVGPGRGCLSDSSYVWTLEGYKRIKDILVNYDKVVNANGKLVKVVGKSEFDVNEDILEIKSYYDFWSSSEFTKDHKILIKRGEKKNKQQQTLFPSNKDNKWSRADEVKIGDYVCIPKMNYFERGTVSYWKNHPDELCDVDGNIIIEKTRINKFYYGSIRHMSEMTGLTRGCLKNIVDNGTKKCRPDTIRKLEAYIVEKLGMRTIANWRRYVKYNKYKYSNIPKQISIDRDFAKFIGLWIGDGCYKFETGVSIFLGPNDTDALNFLRKYLVSLGIRFREYSPKNKQSLIVFDIQSRIIYRMFYTLFGKVHSSTKFIPDSFTYSRELAEGILVGLIWSDGSLSGGRVSFDTTSNKLAFDIRTLAYYLDTPSSVNKRVYKNSTNKDSYKLRFARSETICRLFGINAKKQNYFFEDDKYMYCAVREINKKEFSGKVYDLEVEGNSPSFLSGGYIVHNSAAGSLVSYCLTITEIEPIKFGLIWERFYNAGRKGSLADIDIDFSKRKRGRVIKYIRERFGSDRVAQMVTFNRLMPKAVLKDVAKILGKRGMSFDDANVMTRLIGLKAKTIEKALEASERLQEYEKKNPKLFELAKKLQGCQKSRGKHAAGLIISDEPFSEGGVPLGWDTKEKTQITAWDGETLDNMGFLKVDILGLKTMDVLGDMEEEINGAANRKSKTRGRKTTKV